MKIAVLLVCVALAFADFPIPRDSEPVLDDALIAAVNAVPGWTAGRSPRFEGVSWEQAKRLCGTILSDDVVPEYVNTFVGDIPDEFSSADNWPQCADIINEVLDQGQCGSCWAFGAAESLEDRRCIGCDGVQEFLSEQDLVSCDNSDYGCQGGYLDHAWNYLTRSGVVSEECYPYTSGTSGQTGRCYSECTGTGTWDKHFAQKGSVVQPRREKDIQTEIMKNGPVEAGFTVYQDFFSYTGGVYRHRSGGVAGGHAVEIQGWGNEDGDDYWLVKNSWGPGWGMAGFFKILRGKNECGIESNIVAGLAEC